jgi:hypothetical protein
MPELLWNSAGQLGRQYGVCRVARYLRLDYYSLKERIQYGTELAGPGAKANFIELPAIGLAPECSIELEHPRGARMRIHVKGTALPDLASITRAFCGGKR